MNKKIKAKFNHLKNHPSDFLIFFLKNYSSNLNLNYRIADVGCGHMRNSRLLYDIGFRNINCFDITTPMPKFDYENTSINFRKFDIRIDNFLDETFDIVLFNFVFMFIEPEYQIAVLEKLASCSKKYLLIETYSFKESVKAKIQESAFQEFNFKTIFDYFDTHNDFDIKHLSKSSQRILLERKCYG